MIVRATDVGHAGYVTTPCQVWSLSL